MRKARREEKQCTRMVPTLCVHAIETIKKLASSLIALHASNFVFFDAKLWMV